MSSDSSTGGSGSSNADDYTITNDDSITAETITNSELVGTTWSYDGDGYTMTLKFESDKVTEYEVYDGGSSSGSYTYTYNADGSVVTIYDGEVKWGELIYLSGKLVQVKMIFTLEGSSGSGSSISLAGTTWTCDTIVYKFGSDGTVTSYADGDQNSSPSIANYTVSGSTVTILQDGKAVQELIYLSGKLIDGTIYTKVVS